MLSFEYTRYTAKLIGQALGNLAATVVGRILTPAFLQKASTRCRGRRRRWCRLGVSRIGLPRRGHGQLDLAAHSPQHLVQGCLADLEPLAQRLLVVEPRRQ